MFLWIIELASIVATPLVVSIAMDKWDEFNLSRHH